MTKNSYPSISVADFAEQLLNEQIKDVQEGNATLDLNSPTPEIIKPDGDMIDIRKVEVPDDFIQEITKSPSPKRETKTNPISSASNLMESLSVLSKAIQQVQAALKEMTTVGAIGVNMAGAQKDSKKKKKGKDNPWAICHASTGPKKNEKFERCVKHVKNKKKNESIDNEKLNRLVEEVLKGI